MSTIYVEPVTDALREAFSLPAGARLAVTERGYGVVDLLCTDLDAVYSYVICTMPDVIRTVNGAARAWAEATGATYGGWLPADPVPVAGTPAGGRDGRQPGGAA